MPLEALLYEEDLLERLHLGPGLVEEGGEATCPAPAPSAVLEGTLGADRFSGWSRRGAANVELPRLPGPCPPPPVQPSCDDFFRLEGKAIVADEAAERRDSRTFQERERKPRFAGAGRAADQHRARADQNGGSVDGGR
jgi:hypothetical protein